MGLVAQQTLDELYQAASIHEVVTGYVPLKKAGAHYKGLCPFHKEKTPSFVVTPAKGIFKCFGCGKSGNVITFVRDVENISFAEAVQVVAERYQIQVKFQGGGDESERVDIYRVQEVALRYFRRHLEGDEGRPAREYLGRRAIRPETWERFQIGWAPDSRDALSRVLAKSGFKPEALHKSGLLVDREGGGTIDRFRGRLMFPIRDARGKVIAFGGRLLGDGEPKYLNSPETPIFRKGKCLYGVDVLREQPAPLPALYIVEGYFDVIGPVQEGLRGFLAPLGTAFGAEHARLVRRYSERVVLVFDADAAGRKAAERSLDVLLEEDIDVRIAAVSGGKDPADVVRDQGVEALRQCLDGAKELFDFLVERMLTQFDLASTAGKARAARALLERVVRVRDAERRDQWVQRMAERLDLDRERLKHDGAAAWAKHFLAAALPEGGAEAKSPQREIARNLLEIAFSKPSLIPEVRRRLGPEGVPTEAGRRAVAALFALFDRRGPDFTAQDVQAELGEDAEAIELVCDAQEERERSQPAERQLDSTLRRLAEWTRREKTERAMERLRSTTGAEAARALEDLQGVMREEI